MIISFEHITKQYRDGDRSLTILEDLNANFPTAQSIAIVGRSGIGKSTLLHLAAGLDQPTRGIVKINGTDIYALSPDARAVFRGKHVGFVFQTAQLLPEFTALENVALPCLVAGMSEQEAYARAKTILEQVGLGERVSHLPGELSGGEGQRVSIARALVRKAKILLCDEPTGSLDTETARKVQGLLFELQKAENLLLVMVTHAPELAALTSVIYEMQPGGRLQARHS